MSAGRVDDPLRAVEVFLEGAAEQLDIVLAVLLVHVGGRLVLVQALDPDLVVVGAALVAGLDTTHAGSMAEVVCRQKKKKKRSLIYNSIDLAWQFFVSYWTFLP